MRIFLLSVVFAITSLFTITEIKAQYVTIPDANFSAWLQANYPSCMNGNMMDTTCSAVLSATSLNVNTKAIADLTGIQYFKSIKSLDCGGNNLTTLPILPDSLKSFSCSSNKLVNITSLPNTLTFFNCQDNLLTSISSFSNVLDSLYCSSNQLTVLPSLPNSITYLDCSSNQLNSLPTLPNGLIILECDNNLLTSLPALSNSLTVLSCRSNSLTSLPALPASLRNLDCSYNKITFLPVMPVYLMALTCSNNLLTYLPSLPSEMQSVDCSYNQIGYIYSIPNNAYAFYCNNNNLVYISGFPENLGSLYCQNNLLSSSTTFNNTQGVIAFLDCSYNQFTDLDIQANVMQLNCSNNQLQTLSFLRPSILNLLDCSYNQLTSLQPLNVTLSTLNCSNNKLTSFPPNTGADNLDCSNNKLTSISGIGAGITLNCSNNQIKNLPVQFSPSTTLNCSNNQLNCLPVLASTLETLYASGNNITCLPNLPLSLYETDLARTVCTFSPNNPNGCTANPFITGIVFDDLNKNNIQDAGEKEMSNVKIQVQPGNYITTTDSMGLYKIYVDTVGLYTIKILMQDYPAYVASPVSQSASLTSWGQEDSLLAFAMQPISPINDLQISITSSNLARPGRTSNYFVTYSNIGTTVMSGSIQLIADPNVVYQGSNTILTSQSGNTLTWNFSNLQPFQSATITVSYAIPTIVNVGTQLNFNTTVNPVAGDNTPFNNTDILQQTVISSYDPNLKQVSPTTDIFVDDVANQTPFTYTIYFQNTGTDTAFNIVIRDTLSANLVAQEIQTLSSSAPCLFSMCNNAAQWTFNNILLPDSAVNEPHSHGFVKYRIVPKNTLQPGDQITNTANIYFDYNNPVSTNTTINTVAITTGTKNITNVSDNIILYPNPTTGIIHLASSSANSDASTVNILSADGRMVYTASNINLAIGLTIDLSNYSKGMYLVQLLQNGAMVTRKVVAQ